jgi:uncharacterized membrane protein
LTESVGPITVVTAFYGSQTKPKATLRALKERCRDAAIALVDGATMVRDEGSGRLRISETIEPAPEEGASGGAPKGSIIRILFPAAVLRLMPVGVGSGAALNHFTRLGFHTNLLKQIGENIPPGGFALVAVVEEQWAEMLATAIEGYNDFTRYALDAGAIGAFLQDIGRSGGSP